MSDGFIKLPYHAVLIIRAGDQIRREDGEVFIAEEDAKNASDYEGVIIRCNRNTNLYLDEANCPIEVKPVRVKNFIERLNRIVVVHYEYINKIEQQRIEIDELITEMCARQGNFE